MKVNAFLFTLSLGFVSQIDLLGQWSPPSGGITYANPSTLSVGIGIASPSSKLHVFGGRITVENSTEASTQYKAPSVSQSWDVGTNSLGYYVYEATSAAYRFVVNKNGNVGVGLTNPAVKFEVAGPTVRFANPATTTDAYTSFRLGGPNYPYGLEIDFFGNNNITSNLDWSYNGGPGSAAIVNFNPKPLVLGTNNLCRMMIKGDGNVLIGKTTQTNNAYKLDVDGAVRASEIVVNTTGADFVFDEEYKLRPLEELAGFIRENKHLPEIEPAKCMEENGVELGTLQVKLLQKIEELTLYIIEQNNKLVEQQREIELLKKSLIEN